MKRLLICGKYVSAASLIMISEELRRQEQYNRLTEEIRYLCGNDKLVQIVEAESEDFSRRIACLETTKEEFLAGADYSQCETIEDMSKVYSGSVLRRLGF